MICVEWINRVKYEFVAKILLWIKLNFCTELKIFSFNFFSFKVSYIHNIDYNYNPIYKPYSRWQVLVWCHVTVVEKWISSFQKRLVTFDSPVINKIYLQFVLHHSLYGYAMLFSLSIQINIWIYCHQIFW